MEKTAWKTLKTLKGKKAIIVVGGGSMKRFGFLDKVENYLQEAGMETQLIRECRAGSVGRDGDERRCGNERV